MRSTTHFRQVLKAVGLATAMSLWGCGGSTEDDPSPASASQAGAASALQGPQVADRAQALQIAARGIVAPLQFSELAHGLLRRVYEPGAMRSASAVGPWRATVDVAALGDPAWRDGSIGLDVEDAENAQGLLLRGEAGRVRAVLRFDHVSLASAGHVDGAITLEVSRQAAGAASSRSSQADVLSVSDGTRTLSWSYLFARIDAQEGLQRFNVVSDVPLEGADAVSADVTLGMPADAASPGTMPSSQHYVARGLTSSLDAGLVLHAAANGEWTIDVDNGKDDRVDFVVQTSLQEARALRLVF